MHINGLENGYPVGSVNSFLCIERKKEKTSLGCKQENV
jgi:hypothetical protein